MPVPWVFTVQFVTGAFLHLRSLLCGETSQPINLSFASPSKASGASSGVTATLVAPDVPMPASMATSTPIKLPGSPHKSQSASVASSWPGARSASPVASSLMSSSPGSSAGVTPDNATEAKRARSGSLLDSVAHSARMVVEVCLVVTLSWTCLLIGRLSLLQKYCEFFHPLRLILVYFKIQPVNPGCFLFESQNKLGMKALMLTRDSALRIFLNMLLKPPSLSAIDGAIGTFDILRILHGMFRVYYDI